MIYVWQCTNAHNTEVQRSVANIDVPPEKCEACEATELTRIIVRPNNVKGYILEGGGWHENLYTKNGPIT